MARPKPPEKPTDMPTATPEAPVEAVKSTVMSIRGTVSWKSWLDRYAASRRVTATAMIDVALAEAAARDGFEPPPPRF